ncbi:glycosyltransferase [Bacillus kwashiorkori]|uniref:glycosyltransferase family protein n=1 Tax=Bacillus kwashiorkori TaxID=1522318 RepID=UPI0007805F47|nr:glycosyltransferase [Bacillus kwashiorkori]
MVNKLKLLFITKDFTKRLEKSTVYLIEELTKITDLRIWYDHGSIISILEQLNFQPDYILLNDYKSDYCPFIFDLNKINIPIGAIMHDLKYKPFRRAQFYERENIRTIFTIYRDAAQQLYPQFQDRFVWLPHHVPTNIFRDYQLEKNIDVLMMGALYRHMYPMRAKFYEILKNHPGFTYHSHPGYEVIEDFSNVYAGEKYAREINRAKIFVTCDSVDRFPVMKYYEATACRSLLLATPSKELADLGFIDGETFVAINEENVLNKIHFYLQNESERLKIAKKGYEMVRSRHSTEIRAQQLVAEIIKRIN